MSLELMPPLSLLEGSTLTTVELREYDWAFQFDSGVGIVAESSHWRLVDNDRVIITDQDHGQLFGLKEPVDASAVVRDQLKDATVTAMGISVVSDLLLDFSSGHTLEVLIGSAGYENWHVRGPDGSHTFAIGGGQICRLAP